MGKISFYHKRSAMVTVETVKDGQRFKTNILPQDTDLEDNRTVSRTSLLVYLRGVIADLQEIENRVANSSREVWQVVDPEIVDDCPF